MPMLDWEHYDEVVLDISSGVKLTVYRRDDRLVNGPCMSLFVGKIELARWDLPEGEPHVHWAIGNKPRFYMPRDWSRELLIELACSQLLEHTRVMWRLIKPRGGQKPTREQLEEAAGWARDKLLERA